MSNQDFLRLDQISYYFQDGDEQRYILRDISCSFEKGVFYTILGASGSGKTTLLSLLSALDKPSFGHVIYENQTLEAIGYENYRRNKVGIVFQQYNLIQFMTAAENVQVAMSITDNPIPRRDRYDSGGERSIALNLLDYLGIDQNKADRTVNKLSGGEQQRVAIARALSTNVDLILADEPTGNINEEMAEGIVDIFKKLAHQHNKCVIVVTHSSQIASQSDVVFRLSKGELIRDE